MRDHQLDINADVAIVDDGDEDDRDRRVLEWEDGLPTADDLTPLSQLLIPPDLASAFRIEPELPRTSLDVHRASQNTLDSLFACSQARNTTTSDHYPLPVPDVGGDTATGAGDESSSRAAKRQRLVWTPQLHKRFVEVVAHLGLKSAVPKTIMQLMNVEGLTRENVASHLQKYRLYVKRMQGIPDDGPLSPTAAAATSPGEPAVSIPAGYVRPCGGLR